MSSSKTYRYLTGGIYAVAAVAAAGTVFTGCAHSKLHEDDTEIVAKSAGHRPDWVDDSNNQSQKKMRDIFDDKQDHPKYFYVVSQAFVDNEDLVPNCYEFAGGNSATELAHALNAQVTSATSESGDGSSMAAYAETLVKTHGTLVGAETLARYWEKTKDKDDNRRVTCWIATGVPNSNFEKAKALMERKLEDAQAGGTAKRVKGNVQEAVDETKSD